MELDPRYLIARETNFVDHDISEGLHAVNLELADEAGNSRRSQLQTLLRHLGQEGRIDEAHLKANDSLTVATAEVTVAGLRILEGLVAQPLNSEQDRILRRFEYAQGLKPPRIRPFPGLKLPDDIEVAPSWPRAKSGVVFAVIDYGCPFMHPLLSKQSGEMPSTRVRALWNQHPARTNDPRTKPRGFGYGTELSRDCLNAVIGAAAGDERVAYESLGYQALRMRESHGAHALGMLLDDDSQSDESTTGELPDVLFVQLPQGLLSAPNRGVLSRHVVDALVWIESHRQAEERVILSLSEGSSQGPNDGSSIVERALHTFTQWGRGRADSSKSEGLELNRIYIAAGNGFDEKLHAQANLHPAKSSSFLWRVPPASELPASVEIWLPTGGKDSLAEVQVELFAPDGRLVVSAAHSQVGPDKVEHWPDVLVAAASVASTSWRGKDCSLCLIRLAPTASFEARACAPVGDWTIKLTTKTALEQPVHLFIGRIKQALGFPLRTAQSTFVSIERPGFIGPSGEGTLQGLATAEGVVRVGGIVAHRGKPAPTAYSSRGPSRDGSIVGPDVSVRVDEGDVLKGKRSIGNRSGVSFRMNGTSVGAPLAARLDHARPRPPDRPRGRRGGLPKEQSGDAGAMGELLPERSTT